MPRHPWRVLRTLAVTSVATAALVTAVVVVPTADAQPAPGLTDIRVGRHATYDRIVLDFRGPLPSSWHAAWVRTLTADPSGKRITLPGNAFLSVVTRPASAVGAHPRSLRTPQLTNVRAVAITGDFERVLSIGVGARHRSWVHVFRLAAPNRLVVDVGR
jgi:hypothetical protein